MNYIKIFEAFKQEEYKKAFTHIKSLVNNDAPKKDIIDFIDKFTSDLSKEIDNLRIIIERTAREFNLKYTSYHFFNRKRITSKKRKPGSDYSGSWEAGEMVTRDKFDSVRYYMFDQGRQEQAKNFLSSQINQYNIIIKNLSHLDITRLKFFCDRFFEILEWCVETGPEKKRISSSNLTDEEKKSEMDRLIEFDMENEYDEINILVKRIKKEIATLLDI